jgi:hypothetical protein
LYKQLNLDSVTEDVNEKHLEPWSELCKNGGVVNTPLTPYLDRELLKDNALSVDGTKVRDFAALPFLLYDVLACLPFFFFFLYVPV